VFFERKQRVYSLRRAQISGVNVLLNLIDRPIYTNRSAVLPLVDVFKQVLDAPDPCGNFDVDVRIELPCQVRVVRYHPPVVIDKPPGTLLKGVPIISSPIDSVTILALRCCLAIRARVPFLASSVHHASCIWVILSAGSVQKTFCNSVEEFTVFYLRELG
jgi:hypothetical protein